jgi:pimeloyl-ACP methyl ester carboxylesterase
MATIVLVHGGLGAEMDADRFWIRPGVVEGLRRYGHQVHAPDRRADVVSWDGQARSLACPPGPFVLVGGSNGCSVAVRLALAEPERVSRLALCWPATAGDPALDAVVPPELAPLLPGETLRGVTDVELGTLAMPVAVLPSVPPSRFHQQSTVDKLLALGFLELPGTPEPPHPAFQAPPFVGALTTFAGGT